MAKRDQPIPMVEVTRKRNGPEECPYALTIDGKVVGWTTKGYSKFLKRTLLLRELLMGEAMDQARSKCFAYSLGELIVELAYDETDLGGL